MDEIRPEIDTPVYVQLAAVIRGMIERGEIPPRHPIPSQRYCRERWGVSGSTFDRATELLKAEGLVRFVKGKGLYVVPEEERES